MREVSETGDDSTFANWKCEPCQYQNVYSMTSSMNSLDSRM